MVVINHLFGPPGPTRQERKAGGKPRAGKPKVGEPGAEYWNRLGPNGVKDMNPGARHPNMPPTGANPAVVYILGEAPGADEDEAGRQFVGRSGQLLREQLDSRWDPFLAWDNCCRTRPPGNRTPNFQEVECFRNSVRASIEERQPAVILGAGSIPLHWALPNPGTITLNRGRRFPIQIGGHAVWFCPIHHPSYILRVKDQKRVDDIPGSEWERAWQRDLAQALQGALTWPQPHVESPSEENLMEGVELLQAGDRAVRRLCQFMSKVGDGEMAIDIETTSKRPYSGGRIRTISVSDGDETLAFPYEEGWANPDSIVALMEQLVAGPAHKVCHNLNFELEWFVHRFGKSIIRSVWHDTMIQAYVLDERPGGLGLGYLCLLHFGLPLKDMSEVDRKEIAREPLPKLLRYNALDSKYTAKLNRAQRKLFTPEIELVYDQRLMRVSSAVLGQHRGLGVDVARVEELKREFDEKIQVATDEIMQHEDVKLYEASTQDKFSPRSNQKVAILFRDVLKRSEGQKKEKYCVDKNVLEQIDLPIAKMLSHLRTLEKMRGTYITKMHPKAEDSYVFPDGLLHPQVKVIGTVTGRFSYADPNHNFPKRDPLYQEIRSQVVPHKDCLMVSADYGQIEARVLAMHSKDEFLCKAIWEKYDIHMDWAKYVADLWPPTFKKYGSNMKRFRSEIKNLLVFPTFYGAKEEHITRLLDLPNRVGAQLFDKFWSTFPGIRRWQEWLLKTYLEKGYVECLSGYRRHAPLSRNMVYNSPIQGDAAEIAINSMCRLSDLAIEEPYLQTLFQIHDDLTFSIPKDPDIFERALERIVNTMIRPPFNWVTLPIEVEVSVGPNWHRMDPIGKFQYPERI